MTEQVVFGSTALMAVALLLAAGLRWEVELHLSCPWVWLPPRWLSRQRWFRRRAPSWAARGCHLKLWNLFKSSSGGYWGVGILQVRRRHMVAAIHNSDNPKTVWWVLFWRVR